MYNPFEKFLLFTSLILNFLSSFQIRIAVPMRYMKKRYNVCSSKNQTVYVLYITKPHGACYLLIKLTYFYSLFLLFKIAHFLRCCLIRAILQSSQKSLGFLSKKSFPQRLQYCTGILLYEVQLSQFF